MRHHLLLLGLLAAVACEHATAPKKVGPQDPLCTLDGFLLVDSTTPLRLGPEMLGSFTLHVLQTSDTTYQFGPDTTAGVMIAARTSLDSLAPIASWSPVIVRGAYIGTFVGRDSVMIVRDSAVSAGMIGNGAWRVDSAGLTASWYAAAPVGAPGGQFVHGHIGCDGPLRVL